MQLERMYDMHLEVEDLEHTNTIFDRFMQKNGKGICPEHGVVTYVDGKVKCSVHTIDDEELPFL